jgi:transcriptional regulator with XRE-family HTH domain
MTKHTAFDEQLRRAIDASGMSRRAISKATGIDESNLSKFMSGKAGLSVEGINNICKLIGAKLVPGKPKAGKLAAKDKRRTT